MAFLRFSRDKRGYEYFALVQPTSRRGKSVSRVLYAFRSPPNVKVGREPFDDAARRALEAQYPDVAFDWVALSAVPLPAVEPERWRERRNAEREAKLAAQAEAIAESAEVEPEDAVVGDVAPLTARVEIETATADMTSPVEPTEGVPQPARRRRRRRRGRRGRTEVQEVQEVKNVQDVLDEPENL